jgi:L-ascorbate metabolism protein UlaG (beta-lactamase superfamily)
VSHLKSAERLGKIFQNPIPTDLGGPGLALKVLPLYLRQKEQVEPKTPLGPFRTDGSAYASRAQSGLRVTWFGHSASLIEIDGARVLIDPVWDERASPFSFMGPKRFFAPTIPLAALPPLDAVIISHDHYDHLGAKTAAELAKLQPNARWITSLGVGNRLRRFGVAAQQITELNWTESTQIGPEFGQVRVTAWPSRHFSGRTPWDRNTTLWSSFVLEGPVHRVYYGADTGPWDGIQEIAAQYAGFDLVMLEIGAWNALWGQIHLGPDNAVAAFRAMGQRGGLFMPIHWGLFNLALHAWNQPIERVLELAGEQPLPLWLPAPGTPTEVVRDAPLCTYWWRQGV